MTLRSSGICEDPELSCLSLRFRCWCRLCSAHTSTHTSSGGSPCMLQQESKALSSISSSQLTERMNESQMPPLVLKSSKMLSFPPSLLLSRTSKCYLECSGKSEQIYDCWLLPGKSKIGISSHNIYCKSFHNISQTGKCLFLLHLSLNKYLISSLTNNNKSGFDGDKNIFPSEILSPLKTTQYVRRNKSIKYINCWKTKFRKFWFSIWTMKNVTCLN